MAPAKANKSQTSPDAPPRRSRRLSAMPAELEGHSESAMAYDYPISDARTPLTSASTLTQTLPATVDGASKEEEDPPSSTNKRRAESPTPPQSATPKRRKHNLPAARKHAEYWHLDGNVVVQVKDVYFKLHRSQLARQSSFFAELFDPDAANSVGEVDGYPLYHISRVTLKDFETLLSALDDAITFQFQQLPFHTLASILRAACELSFPKFRDWAVKSLQSMWPDDVSLVTTERLPWATETVNLATTYDIPHVVRRAFYELLRTGGFGQVGADGPDQGPPGDDGDDDGGDMDDEEGDEEGGEEGDDKDDEEADEAEAKTQTQESDANTGVWSTLSLEDTRLLVTVRERLTSQWLLTAASAPTTFVCPSSNNTGDGKSKTLCPAAGIKSLGWIGVVIKSGILEDYLYDPICGLDALCNVKWRKEGYCDGCIKERRMAWGKQKKKLWDNLQLWLELGE